MTQGDLWNCDDCTYWFKIRKWDSCNNYSESHTDFWLTWDLYKSENYISWEGALAILLREIVTISPQREFGSMGFV